MRKMLFLDFDGVLHPTLCGPDEFFSALPLLAECLAGAPCEIVFSSSWRFHHSLAELKGHFPEPLRSRIVGVTGDAITGPHARYHEIRSFLHAQDTPVDWRALDDSAYEFPRHCPELVLCDGRSGVSSVQCEQLRHWLGRPQRGR